MTMLTPDFSSPPDTSTEVSDPITKLLRAHARELISVALETEVQLVLNQLRSDGRDVVRNGYLPGRHVTTAVGDVAEVPRIRSRDGEPINFASSMIPRYLRRSLSISAWAAYAYLKGTSERDVASVLEVVLGEGAKKLTPSVLSQLKKSWTKEFDEWNQRDLTKVRFTIPLRRRHLPGDPWRQSQDLRAGVDGRRRAGQEALDRPRRRDAGVHPELARGPAQRQGPGSEGPEAGDRRRGARVLGGAL
jgi:hypothetical protein